MYIDDLILGIPIFIQISGAIKPLFITENSCKSFLVILSANMKSSNRPSNALGNALSNGLINNHKAKKVNEINIQKLDSSNGLSNGVSNGLSNGAQKNQLIFKNDENPYVIQILTLLMLPKKRMEIFNAINITNQSSSYLLLPFPGTFEGLSLEAVFFGEVAGEGGSELSLNSSLSTLHCF